MKVFIVFMLLLPSISLGQDKVKSEIYWGMGTSEVCTVDNTSHLHCKLSITVNDRKVIHQCYIKFGYIEQEVPCD